MAFSYHSYVSAVEKCDSVHKGRDPDRCEAHTVGI